MTTILDEWPGMNQRCNCGQFNLPEGKPRGIMGVVHRTDGPCSPGSQIVVARYRGSEYGTGFRKGHMYSLHVIDNSVFMADGPYWYTYKSIEQFFKYWEVDTQV